MNQQELEKAVEVARQAAQEAAVELKLHYGRAKQQAKEGNDAADSVVTDLDRSTEQLIESRLLDAFPDIGFKGEEFGAKGNKDLYWLVDPIDGTAYFVRGLPFCTSMIALVDHGRVVAGVIHDFVEDDVYWAVRGGGAFKNDKPIKVSERQAHDAYVNCEIDMSKNNNHELAIKLQANFVLPNMINCGKDFAWVASGRLDGRIMVDPWGHDWDFAAGALLVEEAGGVVKNVGSNGEFDFTNHNILAVNPAVYEQLTQSPNAIFPIEETA